jgi:RNA polymerase sigma factor (sigma-70 family)
MPDHDRDLVRRLASGDSAAYAVLQEQVHRAFEQVWAKVRHRYPDLESDRLDLMQAFEIHLVNDDYRVLRTFSGRSKLSTWLFAVAMRHVSRNAQNLAKLRAREGASIDPDCADEGTDPEVRTIRNAEREVVRKALLQLDAEDRTLVAMFYEQGLDASQVGRVLNISAAGVRMRKKRLLARLEKKLHGAT